MIYGFAGSTDGEYTDTDLVTDAAGNIYGTSVLGGTFGSGTVFQLSPSASGWTHTVLYSFTGGADGGEPYKGVTLDAQGNQNAVFIFQVGSTLTTLGSTQVILAGNAQAKNVFWQVGSSATLGTNSAFSGTILSLQSITLDTGASLHGRALARNGAVTLDSNAVTAP